MTVPLPRPPGTWTTEWQTRLNQAHDINDKENRKKRTDIELEPGAKLILRSPNGQRWQVEVSNAGAVSAAALP
jgi:hypothetical protein